MLGKLHLICMKTDYNIIWKLKGKKILDLTLGKTG